MCEVCVSGSSAGEQLLARVLARASSLSPPAARFSGHRPCLPELYAATHMTPTQGDGCGRVLGKCVVNINTDNI